MDIDDLETSVTAKYNEWCNDNGYETDPEELERIIAYVIERIEELMLCGYEVDDAYEEYQSEIYDDMEYLTKERHERSTDE